ncbi:MAG TPA: S8 family serine peptidase [Longimicrobiaceae bacterium]|nr:S8 family serine peptidase [Longimicrobiaceae bacterium]
MPDGLTLSMKITQNCNITGCNESNSSDTYAIEDDDFYWGVKWASNSGVEVLSMSFSSSSMGASVYNALYDAYYTDDILLLAATGNAGSESSDYPRQLSFVMGVGGLNSDGSNYGLDQYEDVSAYAGGNTTVAYCPFPGSFCTPGATTSVGGTSSATAIAAGIAGLVRANEPSLTAQQVRDRLITTARGPHNKLDALAAVTNDRPLQVTISGPTYINAVGLYDWEANPSYGNSAYSYSWEFSNDGSNWSPAGSGKDYSRYIGSTDTDFVLRVTVTSGSETDSDTHWITVATSCYPQVIC